MTKIFDDSFDDREKDAEPSEPKFELCQECLGKGCCESCDDYGYVLIEDVPQQETGGFFNWLFGGKK